MGKKSKTPGVGDVSAEGNDESISAAGLASLQADCSRELTRVAARVQERVGRAFADYQRAIGEAQIGVLTQQDNAMREYAARMQSASSQANPSSMAEISRDYQDASHAARDSGQALADGAAKNVQKTIENAIEEANQEWDAAIERYIAELQEAVGQLPTGHSDPAALAALSHSFAWVAGQVHPGRADSKQ